MEPVNRLRVSETAGGATGKNPRIVKYFYQAEDQTEAMPCFTAYRINSAIVSMPRFSINRYLRYSPHVKSFSGIDQRG
jgi:hypothetical protein